MNPIRPRDVALFSGATVFGLVLTFVSGVVAARWLGPYRYGELSLVRSAYALLAIVAPLGLDVALLRHLGENGGDWPRSFAELRRFRLVCAGLNFAVVVIGALWLGPWLGAHVYHQPAFALLLALALLALPFAADAAIVSATLRALGAVSLQNIGYLVLQPVVRTGAMLLLLTAGWGSAGVVSATALGAAASAAALAMTLQLVRRRSAGYGASGAAADPRVLGRVFAYSLWLAALLLLNNGLRVVDVLALGRFRPSDEVGRYAALSAIAALIAVPPQGLSQTLAPTVARLHARGDRDGVRGALGGHLRRSLLVASPLFAGVAVFGPWFDLVLGPGYRFGDGLCLVVAGGYLVTGCLGQMGVSLTMTGRHRQEFAVLAFGALVALALCWLLAPRLGGVGVGLGVLAGAILLNGLRTVLSVRLLGGLDIRPRDALVPPLACLVLAGGWRLVLERFLPHGWSAAILGAAGLAAGFAGLYALLLTAEEKRDLAGASWRR